MDSIPNFIEQVKAIIQSHGTTVYVAAALDDLDIKYVDDVEHETFFLRRVEALKLEDL